MQTEVKIYQVAHEHMRALFPKSSFCYGMGTQITDIRGWWRDGMYKHVASMDVDDSIVSTGCLHDVFEESNLRGERIRRHRAMHSVSVGDILEFKGVAWVVAPDGFDKVA
tara:strand:- start:183 stop:512 length:330 start_codon:yes stop_codon:yes gene_type:complete